MTAETAALVGSDVSDIAAFELAFARHVTRWSADAATFTGSLEVAVKYAAWALQSAAGAHRHAGGVLFKVPRKIDPLTLIDHAVDRRLKDGMAIKITDPNTISGERN